MSEFVALRLASGPHRRATAAARVRSSARPVPTDENCRAGGTRERLCHGTSTRRALWNRHHLIDRSRSYAATRARASHERRALPRFVVRTTRRSVHATWNGDGSRRSAN